jgi:hypothetical protein
LGPRRAVLRALWGPGPSLDRGGLSLGPRWGSSLGSWWGLPLGAGGFPWVRGAGLLRGPGSVPVVPFGALLGLLVLVCGWCWCFGWVFSGGLGCPGGGFPWGWGSGVSGWVSPSWGVIPVPWSGAKGVRLNSARGLDLEALGVAGQPLGFLSLSPAMRRGWWLNRCRAPPPPLPRSLRSLSLASASAWKIITQIKL